jgi:hypothetical protein
MMKIHLVNLIGQLSILATNYTSLSVDSNQTCTQLLIWETWTQCLPSPNVLTDSTATNLIAKEGKTSSEYSNKTAHNSEGLSVNFCTVKTFSIRFRAPSASVPASDRLLPFFAPLACRRQRPKRRTRRRGTRTGGFYSDSPDERAVPGTHGNAGVP